MSWAQCPPEILASIFNHLPVNEVKNVTDVNKESREIATNLVLIPKGHLLLKHAPSSVWKTPVHTIHIDGSQNIRNDFSKIQENFQLTQVTTIVLHDQWTILSLTELSQCLECMPQCNTLEIFNASPVNMIVHFLLMKHDLTKVRCFLRTEKQLRSYRRFCDNFRKIHGLFEEILVSIEINNELTVYAPKLRSMKYPSMEMTSSLTIHPARLSKCAFLAIRDLKSLKSLTLNYPREIHTKILTDLSSSSCLRKLALHNAKSVSHDCWKSFLQCQTVTSLDELAISGKTQIDSSIFDTLDKNYNLRKLYIELSSPCCSADCRLQSMLTWCPNVEVLVLCVPFSLVGLEDLENINEKDFKRLCTLKVLFQLTPDSTEPYKDPSLEDSQKQLRERVQSRLPNASVHVEYKRHLREFVFDDEDDFD